MEEEGEFLFYSVCGGGVPLRRRAAPAARRGSATQSGSLGRWVV